MATFPKLSDHGFAPSDQDAERNNGALTIADRDSMRRQNQGAADLIRGALNALPWGACHHPALQGWTDRGRTEVSLVAGILALFGDSLGTWMVGIVNTGIDGSVATQCPDKQCKARRSNQTN